MKMALRYSGEKARFLLLELTEKIGKRMRASDSRDNIAFQEFSRFQKCPLEDVVVKVLHLPVWVSAWCLVSADTGDIWLGIAANPELLDKYTETQIALHFQDENQNLSNSCMVASWCMPVLSAELNGRQKQSLVEGRERISGFPKIITLPAPGDAVLKLMIRK